MLKMTGIEVNEPQRDGWITIRRWGDWHFQRSPLPSEEKDGVDSIAYTLTWDPAYRDYNIDLHRVHELDWHAHLRSKPWFSESVARDFDQAIAFARDHQGKEHELGRIAATALCLFEGPRATRATVEAKHHNKDPAPLFVDIADLSSETD